jgi:hypothetical protein
VRKSIAQKRFVQVVFVFVFDVVTELLFTNHTYNPKLQQINAYIFIDELNNKVTTKKYLTD